MRVIDRVGQIVGIGSTIAATYTGKNMADLRVGQVVGFRVLTEDFKVWKTTYRASEDSPFVQLRVAFQGEERPTLVNSVPARFVRVPGIGEV